MPRKLSTLEDLYVDELKDLYSAEHQILKALPRMMKKANSQELKDAIESHRMETEEQVKRLDRIFKDMGKTATGKKCKAMECIIEEGKELMEKNTEPAVLDAGLIASAQKVEHYEISGYGTARTYAQLLGYDEARDLLQTTLDEEGRTDEKLNGLAESINVEATQTENQH
ncbi:MAG: ferritin-like domain-containing protein [Ignavibacteriae bacterium]|nr:MAG: ferritin-like domain-containing protein [Ignavibacteriota bacterium]